MLIEELHRFWEVYNREKVGFIIQILTEELDGEMLFLKEITYKFFTLIWLGFIRKQMCLCI